MAKRAQLSKDQLTAFSSKKPAIGGTQKENPPIINTATGPKGGDRAGTRDNTKGQTLRLNKKAWAQLKYMAIDLERPAHALLVEAVNELFKKYGKEPIA